MELAAKLANIIEYENQVVAKPFMKPAKASSKQCIEVMKSTFDKEVNNMTVLSELNTL